MAVIVAQGPRQGGRLSRTWKALKSSAKTSVALVRSMKVGRPNADKLFVMFTNISLAYAARKPEKFRQLVAPMTYTQMVEKLNVMGKKGIVEWRVLQQDRHSIVQCRILDGKEEKFIQVRERYSSEPKTKRKKDHCDLPGEGISSTHTHTLTPSPALTQATARFRYRRVMKAYDSKGNVINRNTEPEDVEDYCVFIRPLSQRDKDYVFVAKIDEKKKAE